MKDTAFDTVNHTFSFRTLSCMYVLISTTLHDWETWGHHPLPLTEALELRAPLPPIPRDSSLSKLLQCRGVNWAVMVHGGRYGRGYHHQRFRYLWQLFFRFDSWLSRFLECCGSCLVWSGRRIKHSDVHATWEIAWIDSGVQIGRRIPCVSAKFWVHYIYLC